MQPGKSEATAGRILVSRAGGIDSRFQGRDSVVIL